MLFVDGHAAFQDFSRELRKDPWFIYEETKDWMWYKAKPEPEGKDKK